MLVGEEPKWDGSADVVVVGYGLAGAATAITAHDQGAKVLILEKQQRNDHHTNSSLSGAAFIVPADVERVIAYMEDLYRVTDSLSWTDRDVLRAWAERAFDNKRWMEERGATVELIATKGEHRHVAGADSVHIYRVMGSGVRMMRIIDDALRAKGIQILYGVAAENLLTDLHGEVIGIKAKRTEGSRSLHIEAARAVVLTCGGFEYDEQMKLNYLRTYPTFFQGCTANTGDGIRMAQEVGADLWHMNCCSGAVSVVFPGYPVAHLPELGGETRLVRKLPGASQRPKGTAGYIIVDGNGQRFRNEDHLAARTHAAYYEFTPFDTETLRYPRVPSYWIFDQNRIEAGRLVLTKAGASGPQQLYKWSKDNGEELARGWITSAETVGELAKTLGLPADRVEQTVSTYNRYCDRGEDPDFNRRPWTLIPLSRPPFYAVRIWPGGPNTQGGPRRDAKARVLDTAGRPVSRLYAAGELGSIFGMLYPGSGGNLSECIAFGRIAGENAAREQRR